ncbi:MAG: bifunctional hydroxymethylpyrimidine kinase/phosphomethylpyrimidine kinase, partial [Oscillospiraceae bacterium]|nr:bifunctional hydroxymethylpyrimidine kinase/phosphomethylpyrimidine kinase [Oscillospiraceae bacterium]
LIRFCGTKGVKAVVDTSGNALRIACSAKPWAVKPNIHELEELCGSALDTTARVKSAAEELIKSGIQTVVVSLGDKGLIYISEKAAYLSPGLSVQAKCTVGAGDAVTAAIAMGITDGADDETILRYAAACGTAAVTMPGSTMPDRETIEQYLNRIDIIEI